MEQWQYEVIIGVLVALAAAVTGAWLGSHFTKVREDKIRTTELSMRVLSDDTTKKRVGYLKYLNDPNTDAKTLAVDLSQEYDDFRKNITSVFNQYDLICLLHKEGFLNEAIFESYIEPFIKPDYVLADEFLNELRIHLLHQGDNTPRPFFPNISDVVGRD